MINDQIKNSICEGGNFMIISYDIVKYEEKSSFKSLKFTKITFDTTEITKDEYLVTTLSPESFEKMDDLYLLEFLEKVGIILSTKKQKEFTN